MDVKKKLRNSVLISLFITLFLFMTSQVIGQNNEKSKDLSLSSLEEKDKSSGLELYLGGGYLLEISHKKGGEYYFSGGVSIVLDSHLELGLGAFVDYITNGQLIVEANKETKIFPGIELALFYFPFSQGVIRPFLGIKTALTIFPDPFARNSLMLGAKIPIGKTFKLSAHYSINHITSTQLNEFYSHLFSIYFSFRL